MKSCAVHVVIVCLALTFVLARDEENVIVQTESGKLEGTVIESKTGFQIDRFLGVKYGKIPERFAKSEPVDPWTETKQAKKWPPRCMQTFVFGHFIEIDTDTEDCLYLNVFAPHKKVPEGYPVMIFIHGGGYAQGSSLEYGEEGIKNLMVPKGVVVITFHYRLGPWGFFSTGTKDAEGNYGLWDQSLLLKWVQNNIRAFGGNPNKVTLFGESAGAFSTSLQSISPHSRDLFHNAVLMSGSTLSPFSVNDQATIQSSFQLAKNVGCTQKDPKKIVDCMKSLKPSIIDKEINKMVASGLVLLTPRIDNDFLPTDVRKLILQSPKKPTVIGVTLDEVGLFATPPTDEINSMWKIKDPKKFTFDQFKHGVKQYLVSRGYKNVELLTDIAMYHYVDSLGERNNGTFLTQAFIQFVGDYLFYAPANEESKLRFSTGSNIWLYSFDYFNPKLASGSFHLFDLWYLLKCPILRDLTFTEEEEKIAHYYSTLLTNFAKYNNPTPSAFEGVEWPQISEEAPEVYLKINRNLEVGDFWYRRGTAFWNELLPKIESFSSGTRPEKEEDKIKEEL